MDIKLEKKKGWRAIFRKKNLPWAFGGVLLVFVVNQAAQGYLDLAGGLFFAVQTDHGLKPERGGLADGGG